jgi:hypothetical protein
MKLAKRTQQLQRATARQPSTQTFNQVPKCDRDPQCIILTFVLFVLRLANSHQLRVADPHHNRSNFIMNTSLALLSSQSGLSSSNALPRDNPQRKPSTKYPNCDRDPQYTILSFVLFVLRFANSHQLRVANPHHNPQPNQLQYEYFASPVEFAKRTQQL